MAMPFQPGTHVDGMRIVRVIGSGSVATVYEVIHQTVRRALKITDHTIEESAYVERVALEGEALSMVKHGNVVEWFASGLFEGRVWLVVELVEGQNLRQILDNAEDKRLPIERAVALIRNTCEGLLALHRKGIIHRDMKPANILVAGNPKTSELAKVADLNSVKFAHWGIKTTDVFRLTTMRYMAPEVWRGDPLTPKVDVFAMGQILYECIAGKHPVLPENASMASICTAQLGSAGAPTLASVVAGVPSDLSDLVQQAMAVDPAQRPAMPMFIKRLETAQDRLLAWRRAAARSLPIPSRNVGTALTEPMPVVPDMEAPSLPTVSSRPARSAGGTIQMSAAVPTPASTAAAMRAEPSSGREASPPPPPVPGSVPLTQPAPASGAPTLRVLSRPGLALQVAPATEEVRRSTGIPVESAPRPSAAKPRSKGGQVALGVVVLAAMATGAWWTWTIAGRQEAAPPKPAALPPSPTASASVAKPATSTTSARPAGHPRGATTGGPKGR